LFADAPGIVWRGDRQARLVRIQFSPHSGQAWAL